MSASVRAAVDRCFRRLADGLEKTAATLLPRDLAYLKNDLVQEAFVALLKARLRAEAVGSDGLDTDSQCRKYLYAVLLQRCSRAVAQHGSASDCVAVR